MTSFYGTLPGDIVWLKAGNIASRGLRTTATAGWIAQHDESCLVIASMPYEERICVLNARCRVGWIGMTTIMRRQELTLQRNDKPKR